MPTGPARVQRATGGREEIRTMQLCLRMEAVNDILRYNYFGSRNRISIFRSFGAKG